MQQQSEIRMKGAMDALGADVRTELRLWNSEYGEGMMNGKTEIRSHGSTDFGNYGTELRRIYECLELRNTYCVELRIH